MSTKFELDPEQFKMLCDVIEKGFMHLREGIDGIEGSVDGIVGSVEDISMHISSLKNCVESSLKLIAGRSEANDDA